jgi:hypothetical protein
MHFQCLRCYNSYDQYTEVALQFAHLDILYVEFAQSKWKKTMNNAHNTLDKLTEHQISTPININTKRTNISVTKKLKY